MRRLVWDFEGGKKKPQKEYLKLWRGQENYSNYIFLIIELLIFSGKVSVKIYLKIIVYGFTRNNYNAVTLKEPQEPNH